MAITIPILSHVDFLILRKFPDAQKIEIAFDRIPMGSFDKSYKDDTVKELHEEIQAYRRELEAKPQEELEVFFLQEQANHKEEMRLRAEQEEQKRFWNQPSAQADFIHWGKATYWTLEEAVVLSFGKDPKIVNWDKLKGFALYPASLFIEQYSKVRDLALRAKNWNQLYDPTLPGFYIAWARRNDIVFPKELEEQVIARRGNIGDWKTKYDDLVAQFELHKKDTKQAEIILKKQIKLTSEFDEKLKQSTADLQEQMKESVKAVGNLINERDTLLIQVEVLKETIADNKEKPLKTRERETVLRLIIGMAVDWYGYNPNDSKSDVPRLLETALALHGIPLHRETIRNWLREAAELLPKTEEA